MDAGYAWIVGVWLALHVVALATAFLTRIAAGSRLEMFSQAIFYTAMALMGAAVWLCQKTESSSWGLSAVTLVAMVLTAVVDCRRIGDHPHSVPQQF